MCIFNSNFICAERCLPLTRMMKRQAFANFTIGGFSLAMDEHGFSLIIFGLNVSSLKKFLKSVWISLNLRPENLCLKNARRRIADAKTKSLF